MGKRFVGIAFFVLLLASVACAQRRNTFYVDQFPGNTVGEKATNSQAACVGVAPCIQIFDTVLANFPQGTLPAVCATCQWIDYRATPPVFNPPLAGGGSAAPGGSPGDVQCNDSGTAFKACSALATPGTPAITGTPGALPTLTSGQKQFGYDSDGKLYKKAYSGTADEIPGLTQITKAAVGLSSVDNVQQMPLSYLDTDAAMTANSNTKVPSQAAVVSYVGSHGGGGTSCSSGTPVADGTGTAGACKYDTSYYYQAIASNTWKRVAWDATFLPTVATPTHSPDTSTIASGAPITIATSTSGATLRYCEDTVDCVPTNPHSWSYYGAPVTDVTVTGTHLCSYATKAGYNDSAVKCSTYTVSAPTAVYVQGAGSDDAISGTCVVSLTGTGAGSTIVYIVETYIGSQTVTVADGTNTYNTLHAREVNGGNVALTSFYAKNPAGGNLTITGTLNSSGEHKCIAWEFSGLGGSVSVDGAGAYHYASTDTALDSGAATITAGSLVIGYAGTNGSAGSCTAGSGYTVPAGAAGAMPAVAGWALCAEYQLSSAGGSQDATMTIGTGATSTIVEAAIKP